MELCAAVKRAMIMKGTEEDERKKQCVQLDDLPPEAQRALVNLEGTVLAMSIQREGFVDRLKQQDRDIAQLRNEVIRLNDIIGILTRNNLKKECLRCERQLDDAAVWAMFDAIDTWAQS